MTETTIARGCCEEGAAAARVTRRSLLRALGVGAVAAAASPMVSMQAAFAADPGWSGDTLVVLSLRGGFDGLSAVAPVGDPDYARHRPGIAVPQGAALQLDSTFGLHPALAPLKTLYDAGDLAIVNAAGLPSPNRSHFAAMDEVERAAPGTSARTGWLNRTLGLHADGGPFAAVQLGSSSIPYALLGEEQVLGMSSVDDFDLSGADTPTRRDQWRTALNTMHSVAPAPLAAATGTTLGALDTTAALGATTYVPANGAVYPNSDLGRSLRDTARLIKGDVGTRIVTIDEGDWDMHADLGRVDGGWMRDKLVELGSALAAFATDLGPLMDSVTLVTISEFGRRVEENMSSGVDHGWGNAMFVLGGNVVPGLHGTWPGLADAALVQGDLAVTTDYRAVLADILVNRTGATSDEVKQVFPGYTGTTLGVTTV
jgi:uncharacterized protein (DUF1501 family)